MSTNITVKPDRLLRVREAAEALNLKECTIRSRILAKDIPVIRLSARCIRIKESFIDQLIRDGSTRKPLRRLPEGDSRIRVRRLHGKKLKQGDEAESMPQTQAKRLRSA